MPKLTEFGLIASDEPRSGPLSLHYLAYGSNLHPLRLRKRTPSANLVGAVELPGWSLSFSKRSLDGSGKCTIGFASEPCRVFGAVYSMDAPDKERLDRVEGLGSGYESHWLDLEVKGTALRAFTYVASVDYLDVNLKPYAWYKGLVLAGARYHGFDAGYVRSLEAFPSVRDPDVARRAENDALLLELAPAPGVNDHRIKR